MKFKNLLLIACLFSTATANYNCSPECQAALADLVTEVAFQGTVTIIAGTPFDVPNAIDNALNTLEKCKGDIAETLGAGTSESRLKIDYDVSNNQSFAQNELNNNFSVPAIPPGQTAMQNYSFQFNDPGDYRLITFCDDKKNVEERDESNNDSAPEIAQAGRLANPMKQALIIKVLPNPNFVKKAGQAKVEVLSYSVKIIE